MLLTLLIASALPAAAPVREPIAPTVVNVDAVAVTSGQAGPVAQPSTTTRYCVIAQITGSRLPVKVCRTADDWIAMDGQIPTGRIVRR